MRSNHGLTPAKKTLAAPELFMAAVSGARTLAFWPARRCLVTKATGVRKCARLRHAAVGLIDEHNAIGGGKVNRVELAQSGEPPGFIAPRRASQTQLNSPPRK